MATKLVQKGKKKKEENKISADGFVDYSQWANLRGSEALSKANPSGQRTLLGDRGVCEVFNHTSSKRKSKT